MNVTFFNWKLNISSIYVNIIVLEVFLPFIFFGQIFVKGARGGHNPNFV
jgi:hypothetical protein